MDFLMAVLGLAGAIALFLWGAHMVQTGVQRALGPRLRRVLGLALSNRIKAFFAGIGLTLLLQSSTATCLMAATFTARPPTARRPQAARVAAPGVGCGRSQGPSSAGRQWGEARVA